jgi:nicotinamide mononucleotide transporter
MDPLEIVAVVFGVMSVWLSTREHIASWPTALVNTALYFVVFARAGIYANMGLQVVYFGLSCYGWYAWKYGGAAHTPLVVTRATRAHAILFIPIAVGTTLVLGFTLSRWTDASLPWLDSATTAVSLIAQWMMTRKLLENWILWNVVNVVYVGMYFSLGLVPTALLYVGYLVLATLGFFSWRASLRAQAAAA